MRLGPQGHRLTSEDIADTLAFALGLSGRTRVHYAGELVAAIVARRLVEHVERGLRGHEASAGRRERATLSWLGCAVSSDQCCKARAVA